MDRNIIQTCGRFTQHPSLVVVKHIRARGDDEPGIDFPGDGVGVWVRLTSPLLLPHTNTSPAN